MKAAANGVRSLNVLDGWWVEGRVERVTGGRTTPAAESGTSGAMALYDNLDDVFIPMFYWDQDACTTVMKHGISKSASSFNTHRMVGQYEGKAYLL